MFRNIKPALALIMIGFSLSVSGLHYWVVVDSVDGYMDIDIDGTVFVQILNGSYLLIDEFSDQKTFYGKILRILENKTQNNDELKMESKKMRPIWIRNKKEEIDSIRNYTTRVSLDVSCQNMPMLPSINSKVKFWLSDEMLGENAELSKVFREGTVVRYGSQHDLRTVVVKDGEENAEYEITTYLLKSFTTENHTSWQKKIAIEYKKVEKRIRTIKKNIEGFKAGKKALETRRCDLKKLDKKLENMIEEREDKMHYDEFTKIEKQAELWVERKKFELEKKLNEWKRSEQEKLAHLQRTLDNDINVFNENTKKTYKNGELTNLEHRKNVYEKYCPGMLKELRKLGIRK